MGRQAGSPGGHDHGRAVPPTTRGDSWSIANPCGQPERAEWAGRLRRAPFSHSIVLIRAIAPLIVGVYPRRRLAATRRATCARRQGHRPNTAAAQEDNQARTRTACAEPTRQSPLDPAACAAYRRRPRRCGRSPADQAVGIRFAVALIRRADTAWLVPESRRMRVRSTARSRWRARAMAALVRALSEDCPPPHLRPSLPHGRRHRNRTRLAMGATTGISGSARRRRERKMHPTPPTIAAGGSRPARQPSRWPA